MKHSILNLPIAIVLTVLCAVCFASCSGNDDSSIVGKKEQPSWTAPENYDMTMSMTAIVKVDMTQSYSKGELAVAGYKASSDDLLAAFSDSTCLGVAGQQDGLYFLYITAPKDGGNVVLKYYAATLKNIFVSEEPIPFSNDKHLGTVSEPYVTKFTVEK